MAITAHTAEVESFSVHMSQRRVGGELFGRRTISLHFKPNGEPLRNAYLHFLTGAQGKESMVTGSTIAIDLPAEEFDRWLHLLQTEAPLTFTWTVDEAKQEVLGVSLYTGDEPPGEGLADLTP